MSQTGCFVGCIRIIQEVNSRKPSSLSTEVHLLVDEVSMAEFTDSDVRQSLIQLRDDVGAVVVLVSHSHSMLLLINSFVNGSSHMSVHSLYSEDG
jgi:hypothetical protein